MLLSHAVVVIHICATICNFIFTFSIAFGTTLNANTRKFSYAANAAVDAAVDALALLLRCFCNTATAMHTLYSSRLSATKCLVVTLRPPGFSLLLLLLLQILQQCLVLLLFVYLVIRVAVVKVIVERRNILFCVTGETFNTIENS